MLRANVKGNLEKIISGTFKENLDDACAALLRYRGSAKGSSPFDTFEKGRPRIDFSFFSLVTMTLFPLS